MRRRISTRRRGTALAFTLAVVTVLSALALLVTRSFVTLHQQRTHQQRELQADFLVESGLERAAARLAASPEYQGETWELPAKESGLSANAQMVITIVEQSGKKRIHVKAAYGKPGRQVQAEREVVWE